MAGTGGARTPPPCCDLGPIHGTPLAPPPYTYTDALGFTYHLCAHHYQSVVTGLRRAAARQLPDTKVRTLTRRRPARRRRPDDPTATGEEQRRARLALGWSIRQLEEVVGRSRGQLSAAEHGQRPVDPEVARWVRHVLDDVVPDVVEDRLEAAG